MAFKKGDKKPENSGRKEGTPNALTRTVKETVLAVFNELQNDPTANLVSWAKSEPTEFYKIASKLIPMDVSASVQLTQFNVGFKKPDEES